MLRDVTHTHTDGLLNFGAPDGDGLGVKIGVSPVESAKPVIITGDMDAAAIKNRLGLSPLADAVMDTVQHGAGRVYCVPVQASQTGEVGTVEKTAEGTGSLAASGSPTNAFSVVVKITAQGGFNTAAFILSVDGGYSYTEDTTVPLTGEYEVEGTGLVLQFRETEEAGENALSFVVGDTYRFQTTAPTMTNGEVLEAVDKLRNMTQEFELIHIVGESTPALWQAVGMSQVLLRDLFHKPAMVIMEAQRPPKPEEDDLYEWAFQMEEERKKIKNYDLQVVTAWGMLKKLDGTTRLENLAGVVCGLYAKAGVQESIGKTREEDGFGIGESLLLELQPEGMEDGVIQILDEAGYLTFREYAGKTDYYVYHANMLHPPKSDIRYAEDARVKNKIIRETYKTGLEVLNDDFDMEDIQNELEARALFMFEPLQRMIDAGEISSAEITVPEGQAETFLETETMGVKILYVSRGYIRELDVNFGRVQPSS